MSKKATALTLAAAVAGAMSMAAMTSPAQAEKVKCYGVSKAGENDCGNKKAGHSCKGLSKVSYEDRALRRRQSGAQVLNAVSKAPGGRR